MAPTGGEPQTAEARIAADPSAERPRALSGTAARSPLIAVVAALYAIGLALVLLWPQHLDGDRSVRVRWLLDALAAVGIPGSVAYPSIEAAANVTLFVPAGLLLALAAGRRWRWWIPAIGFAVSLAAETAQATLLPDRTADVRDLVTDTVGTVLGAVALLGADRLRARRRARRPASTELRP